MDTTTRNNEMSIVRVACLLFVFVGVVCGRVTGDSREQPAGQIGGSDFERDLANKFIEALHRANLFRDRVVDHRVGAEERRGDSAGVDEEEVGGAKPSADVFKVKRGGVANPTVAKVPRHELGW